MYTCIQACCIHGPRILHQLEKINLANNVYRFQLLLDELYSPGRKVPLCGSIAMKRWGGRWRHWLNTLVQVASQGWNRIVMELLLGYRVRNWEFSAANFENVQMSWFNVAVILCVMLVTAKVWCWHLWGMISPTASKLGTGQISTCGQWM